MSNKHIASVLLGSGILEFDYMARDLSRGHGTASQKKKKSGGRGFIFHAVLSV